MKYKSLSSIERDKQNIQPRDNAAICLFQPPELHPDGNPRGQRRGHRRGLPPPESRWQGQGQNTGLQGRFGGDGDADGFRVDEPETSFENITHYNNFYEFSTDKEGVASAAEDFDTKGWQVSVEGLVNKPKVFALDDLLKISPPEERIYRMRCVEGWSMVIPWAGFSLSKLLDVVEPLSGAKYVAFETLLDPKRMPGQRSDVLELALRRRLADGRGDASAGDSGQRDLWPCVAAAGWRAHPAGHAVEIRFQGHQIHRQNQAGRRHMPRTSWSEYAPDEYGFYANVNPQVDHPRWSQATEQRIGESGRRPTLMFNGYEAGGASICRHGFAAKIFNLPS